MKKINLHIWISLLAASILFLLTGCKEDNYDYGEFTVNLATCTQTDGAISLRLDDGTLLIPGKALDPERYSESKRVIVNYVFTDGRTKDTSPVREIEIKAISIIFSDILRTATTSQILSLPDDPVYLESVWKSGNYLNFRLQIERNHTIHKLLLVNNTDFPVENGILHLELRHDRQNDSPGFNTRFYASFDISGQLNGVTAVLVKVNAVNYNQQQFTITLPQNNQ